MTRGRPRKTDPDRALDAAMKLFWKKGYDGTSMQDLVNATGMAKPGLYAAFGDKEALYEKTMVHYIEAYGCPSLDYLQRLDGRLRDVMGAYLGLIADAVSNPADPCGCYIVNGMVDTGNRPASFEQLWRRFDDKRLALIEKHLDAATARGELPAGSDSRALATFFAGQAMALAVMGRAGADRESLDKLIETALMILDRPAA